MGSTSRIEWTEATWNPVAGCAIISPGCTNCYAMRMAERLQYMGQEKYTGLTRRTGGRPKWNGNVKLDYEALSIPRSWRTGRMIFVNSMSDLFHEDVPLDFIKEVFAVMSECPQHTFQVLTKRSDRLREISASLSFPSNVWMGVSIESVEYAFRITDLVETAAVVKFVSFEPLLGDVGQVRLNGVHWAIAGGESGPLARPVDPSWVRAIRDQCVQQGVAFHFKQWGGTNKKRTGRLLDGRTWDEFPASNGA